MRVMIGWSAEVAAGVWDKVDVTYDETDWDSIVFECNFVGILVPSHLKFQMMEVEAQRMVAAHVASGHPDLRASARVKLSELTDRRTALVNKILNIGVQREASSV